MDDLPLPKFRLSLFGRFELTGPGGPVDLHNKKVAGLLAYLACTAPEPQPREVLATLLWGSHFEAQARQSLRQAVFRLRRGLGQGALASDGEEIWLSPGVVDCDVAQFKALVREGSRGSLAEAVDLYKGRLLADANFGDEAWADWVAAERQRVEGLALDAMINLGEQDIRSGNPLQSLAVANRAVAINNLREDAHRLVMRALAETGRKAEALKHYEHLASLLKRELDVGPDATTHALAAELRESGPIEIRAPEAREAAAPLPAASAGECSERPGYFTHAPTTQPVPTPMVETAAEAQLAATGAPDTRQPHVLPSANRRPSALWAFQYSPRAAWLLAAVVLLGAFGLVRLTQGGPLADARSSTSKSASTPPAPMNGQRIRVAVLPFRTIGSSDAGLRALAERLTDDFTNYMSRTTTIQVVARQATAQPPADEPPDVRTIGAKLGALYIFIGTIGVQDEKLRLNVSLIDVRSGLHAWSSHFTEDRNRWPSLEDEIVRRATFAVHYQLIRRGDDSLVAPGGEATVSQLLARGWAGITDRGSEEFSTAGAAFSEVLRRDPESRSAMLGLAAYYIAAVAELKLEREPYLTRAEDLMHRILPLRMNDHSAHFHLALLHNLRNNLPAALQALDRAIELNPTHAPAYAHKGRVLIRLQRYEEALENIQYALRLSGGSVPEGWKFWSGMAELELGRDDEARQSFRRAVAALPRNAYVHAGLAAFHAISGEWEDAYRHAAEVRRLTPQLSDQQRLTELNKGPDSHPLQNRLGSGLRLALDATGQQQ